MAPLPVMSHPFKREAVDFTGPLVTKNQEWTKFIIVHMDYHSRWPEAKAVQAETSKIASEFLVE